MPSRGSMYNPISVHEAYQRGDLAALKAALGDPPDFPNVRNPPGFEAGCLEYAIYHSPLELIRTLLELGARPVLSARRGLPLHHRGALHRAG